MSDAYTQNFFDLTLARPVDTPAGQHAAIVHLWWRAPQQGDHLVQVYVDGELHDITPDPSQRDTWLLLDRTRAHRVELLAVRRDAINSSDLDLWQPRPDLLRGWQAALNTTARVAILRAEQLPIDTQITITDNGDIIDAGALWAAEVERSGFGGLFGLGGFGHDDAAGTGLGRGELGLGPLGRDAHAFRWQRQHLEPGPHTLDINARDATGQPVINAPLTFETNIDALPEPPRQLHLAPDFTLTWQ